MANPFNETSISPASPMPGFNSMKCSSTLLATNFFTYSFNSEFSLAAIFYVEGFYVDCGLAWGSVVPHQCW